jgi:monofunctional glycosyltransferase
MPYRMLLRTLRALALLVLGYYALCILVLVYLRFLPPPITMVQAQRQVEAWVAGEEYARRYVFVPRARIADDLARAAVAAEDTRFYRHRGFDWEEVRRAREEAARRGRAPRGASTITQQLVKNVFLTTHRNYLRKAVEVTLTPLTELILGKDRILELYLNVIEWGPGVYGAEAAARHHYGRSAAALSREQATRLAAVIPAPRTRRPERMNQYARTIDRRMRQMGW